MQPFILLSKKAFNPGTPIYSFRKLKWPMLRGQGLGSAGIWNFLWRLGFHPIQRSIEALPPANSQYLLFVDHTCDLDDETKNGLEKWMYQGGKIIATGELNSWKSFLPSHYQWQTTGFNNSHAGLAYLLEHYSPQLITPAKWNFIEHNGTSHDQRFIGLIAAVQGDRHTPHRAWLEPHPQAPAIISNNLFYYLNGHPFSAFQAWLQGQEDLSPWIQWRHRHFWLDEWISFFCDLLIKINVFKEAFTNPGISELKKITIILRHDLDYSRDTTFLMEEHQRKIGSTYAVLKDRNTDFWVKQLMPFQNHETAFHYNTGKRNWLGLLKRFINKKNHPAFIPHIQQILGNGLLKQLKWAKKRGISVQTLHRHLYYLFYPEWVDAMDTVFENLSDVLGSSSLFRAHVLRWGIDRVEGNHGFLAHWPDAQFPLWYPFKLAHAGKNGKILRGWEMASFMEIEPHLLIQLLDHQIKHIPQHIFTLNFHPAHTHQSSLYTKGSLIHFKTILNILQERNIDVLPMNKVLQYANNRLGEYI